MSCDSTKQPSEPQAAQSHFLLDPSDGSGAPGVSRCFLDTAQKRVALETPRGKGRFFFFFDGVSNASGSQPELGEDKSEEVFRRSPNLRERGKSDRLLIH